MIDGKLVLDTDLCKIYFTGAEHRLLIAAESGAVIEHKPFPGDQRGLVAALSLAVDISAGKVWLSHIVPQKELKRLTMPEKETLNV